MPHWEKKGLIFSRDGGGFFKSHAMRAIPYRRGNGVLRLYISSRCASDMMHPTFIDVDPEDPSKIIGIGERPLLALGAPGLFDDSGITLGSIARVGEDDLVYYTGWKRRRYGVSFELSIGVARITDDGDELEKIYSGPILAQDIYHPYLVGGPFVAKDDNGKYRMWYCSGTEWKQRDHGPEPIYTVFQATSENGIDWTPSPAAPCIPYAYDGEVISAPWVVRSEGAYLMYYCFRGSASREAKKYTIGVATSADGTTWTRRDGDAGIGKSEAGWDSEMICYPAIFGYKNKTYLFYSGNEVGRGGLGYAIADRELNIVE